MGKKRRTSLGAAKDDLAAYDDDLLRRVGQMKLEELTTEHELVELEHPDEKSLHEWLANDRVKGKFVPWWHQKVMNAQRWGLPVPMEMYVLAAQFDQLFPNTSNTFNIVSAKPHVIEADLLDYLKDKHGMKPQLAESLSLSELMDLLGNDVNNQNGPLDGGFRWNGKIVELTKPACQLVSYLWAAKERRASVDAVCVHVWRDEEKANRALPSLMSRINNLFCERHIPLNLSSKGGYVTMEDTAASQ